MADSSVLVHASSTDSARLDTPMHSSCPQCGHDLEVSIGDESIRRIRDLEAQVRVLNSRAVTAADKLADYEDEVRHLRASQAHPMPDHKVQNTLQEPTTSPSRPPPLQQTQSQSRLVSLSSYFPLKRKPATPTTLKPLTSDSKDGLLQPSTPGFAPLGFFSRSTPDLTSPASHEATPPTFATDPGSHSQALTLMSLQSTLESERELRQRAESSLTQAQGELEELTAQLFGQANEMVATERKARAKLEERVKILETRDTEKRKRLDRLEKALERIERVRKMVVNVETTHHDEKMSWPSRHSLSHSSPTRTSMSVTQVDDAELHEDGIIADDDDDEEYEEFETSKRKSQKYHEFDVQLKIWRRSHANLYGTGSIL